MIGYIILYKNDTLTYLLGVTHSQRNLKIEKKDQGCHFSPIICLAVVLVLKDIFQVLVLVLGGQVLVLVLGGQVLVLVLVLGGQVLVLVLGGQVLVNIPAN